MTKLFLFIAVTGFLVSCHNNAQEKQAALQQFDSISQELKKSQEALRKKGIVSPSDRRELYDQLRAKYNGTEKWPRIHQVQNEMDTFDEYVRSLNVSFCRFCDDPSGEHIPAVAEADSKRTNEFFLDSTGRRILVWGYLRHIAESMGVIADTATALKMIQDLQTSYVDKYVSEGKFDIAFFKDNPPVAAITILNSFAAKLKNIEIQIINDYLNK